MANASVLNIMAVNLRAAGSKDNTTGQVHGGIYFPEHVKDGRTVSARWEANCFVNHLGYTDSQGVTHEPTNDMIRIAAWNGRNAAPGKGLADIFAKIVGCGKEFSAALRLSQYNKRLIIDNVPMAHPTTGMPITYPGYNFAIKDDLLWGADSANLIAQEIANWPNYPHASFFTRPPFWNVAGHADQLKWQEIIAARMAVVYDGSGFYGYARVVIPEGATIVQKNVAPPAPAPAPIVTPMAMPSTMPTSATLTPPADMAAMFAQLQTMLAQQNIQPGMAIPQAMPMSIPPSAAASAMLQQPIQQQTSIPTTMPV